MRAGKRNGNRLLSAQSLSDPIGYRACSRKHCFSFDSKKKELLAPIP